MGPAGPCIAAPRKARDGNAARRRFAGTASAWEGRFDGDGQWVPGRLLNGDQTHQGRHIRLPAGDFQIQRVRLYRYR